MRSRILRDGLIALLMIAVQVFQSTSIAKQASFQGLEDLQGDGFYSIAYGVSGDGSTAVGYSHAQNNDSAFSWRNGTMTNLGTIENNWRSSSTANAVSANGSVVVGVCGKYNVGNEAFRWENGIMVGLGKISGADYSEAHGVSANGNVVVGYSSWQSTSREEAFRWENGSMIGLGGLLSSDIRSHAYNVSADGSVVVGTSKAASGKNEAFKWENGIMTSLGVLPSGSTSCAYAISSDKSVIVGEAYTNGIEHAFLWQSGVMSDLGVIPGGYSGSSAYDVSADGSIVVGYSRKSNVYSAMIWDEVYGMRDLKSVLVNDYRLNLSGWALTQAQGISDDGRTIVGYGINPQGYTEGWIATVPEPGTILLLGLGTAILRKKKLNCKS